jgi:hypothetical protein
VGATGGAPFKIFFIHSLIGITGAALAVLASPKTNAKAIVAIINRNICVKAAPLIRAFFSLFSMNYKENSCL